MVHDFQAVQESLLATATRYLTLLNLGLCPMCREPFTLMAETSKPKGFRVHHHFAFPCGHHLWSDFGHHRDYTHHDPVNPFAVHRTKGLLLPHCADQRTA